MLRRLALRLVIAGLIGFPAGAAVAQEDTAGLYDRPVLTLDPGMHTAAIRRADLDSAGDYAVTGSHDRTVRIWSAQSGALLRTIRLPRGPGDVGKVYAVAISPDGGLVAAGGWTRWTQTDRQEQIYLFERASGVLVRRIEGLPNVVSHLVFSPDGRYLAAALGYGGLRVYDRETGWDETARDEDYGGRSYGAAFSADGRLATTSWDGHLRLYDRAFKRMATVKAEGGSQPYGIAFDRSGDRLAVGYHDSTAVSLLDGRNLSPLLGPDTEGIGNGSLSSVAWSADGRTLYAGGRYDDGSGVNPIVAWSGAGAGARRELPAGLTTIMSLRPLPDGGLLVGAGDPYLAVLNPDGRPRWTQRPPQADFRAQRNTLGVSADGGVVDFGYEVWGETPARFDLTRLALSLDPPEDEGTAPAEKESLKVEDWIDSFRPALDGKPLLLKRFETSRSLAVHPEGERFVLGTEWYLRAFDAEGKALWQRPAPGPVWAVNITGDGRLAVAAYHDGAIRWHRVDDGKALLAFMPLADRKRWVAWTPEGYYAASPGAGDILGWHVNRGWDAPAEFFPISAFKGFYQPDALPIVLQEMETVRALGLAKQARDRKNVQRIVNSPAPPGAQLHVLTVGISEYANHKHLRLDFADDDARDIANALISQEGSLYARVNVQHLADGTATRREILGGLKKMHDLMQPEQEDVAVIHFSGHGAVVDGVYYLLPSDVEADNEFAVESTGIEIGRFTRVLKRLGERGKVLVLLDACHSGNVVSGTRDVLPPDIEAVREELAAAGNGVIVLTSSTGTEVSRENPDWQNGAFTEAVLEALKGEADMDGDTWISTSELQGYVTGRVRKLTGNAQNPRIRTVGEHHFQARLFVTGL